ncbi:MAG: beta strand repeat-containing protein, partial [Planctomycetaceae bacterium]
MGTATLSAAAPNTAQFSTTALALGQHQIIAVYLGDAAYGGSNSATLTQNVGSATTTTLATSAASATAQSTVTFTATVTAGATGTVNFYDGSTLLGTATLSAASPNTAQFSTSTLVKGSHQIVAAYQGDANHPASESAAVTQTVTPLLTTITLATSAASVAALSTVTFTATVTAGATGTVKFYDGSTLLGTVTLSASSPNTAQFSTTSLSVGSHQISAVYQGDANHATSQSAALTQTVINATSTTLTTSAASATAQSTVTFTATVTSGATGTVNFYDGSTLLGTATLSAASPNTAQFSTTALSVGSHQISAAYQGDATHATSQSAALTQTMVNATSTTLVTSAASATAQSTVTFTATVTAGATGTVKFYDGSTLLGTATLSAASPNTAQFSTTALSIGSHQISAAYQGDASHATSQSAVLTQTVTAIPTLTTLTSSSKTPLAGAPLNLSATVTAGAVGRVSFFSDSILLGTATLSGTSPNTVVLNVTSLSAGSHALTAVYDGEGQYSGSKSAAFTQTVYATSAATSTSLTCSPTTIGYGGTLVLTATVTGSAPGTVVFYDGTTVVGSAVLNGAASSNTDQLSRSNFASGTHSLSARYQGGANSSNNTVYQSSQSTAVSCTVTASSSSTANAMFGETGTTLNITLASNQQLTVQATSTGYSLSLAGNSLTNNWSGTADSYVSASGSTLTISAAGKSHFTGGLVIANATGNTNTAVLFADSGSNLYSTPVSVTLGNSPGAVSFSGNTGFSQASGVNVTSSGPIVVQPGAVFQVVNGALSLSANSQNNASGNFSGIVINGGQVASTGSGSLTLYGVGAAGSGNAGVLLTAGGTVRGGTSGVVKVTGIGGRSTGNFNVGVSIEGDSSTLTQISSQGATVSVSGTGGGTGSSINNYGVIVSSAQVTAGSASAVSVTGTGGNPYGTGGSNGGVVLTGTASQSGLITSSGGDVTVTGVEGGQSSSIGVSLFSNSALTTAFAGGDLTVLTNSLALQGTLSTPPQASLGSLAVTPRTAGVAITLGGSTDVAGGPLAISATEMTLIQGGSVSFGNQGTPNIHISADLATTSLGSFTLSTGTASTTAVAPSQGLSPTATGIDLNLGSSNTLVLGNNTPLLVALSGASADTGYTQLRVTGTVALAGSSLTLSGSWTPSLGNVFTIVSATNVTGTLSGLPQGALLPFAGRSLQVGYTLTSVTLTDVGPAITTQPTNISAATGATATFSVAGGNSLAPWRVQWQQSLDAGSNWSDIPGATSVNYTTPSVTTSNNGLLYRARLWQTSGMATPTVVSNSAKLSVLQPSTVQLNSSASGSVAYGTPLVLSATVTPGATGTVTFFDSSTTPATSLGQVAVSNGTATLTVSTLAAGTHSLTASYGGDSTHAPSASAAIAVQVGGQGTSTISLTPATTSVALGASVALNATVTTTGLAPTGQVNFYSNGNLVGYGMLPSSGPATVSLTWTPGQAGTYSLTASYQGDTNYAGSQSTTKSFSVTTATPTVSLATSQNPFQYGSDWLTMTATVVGTTGPTPTGTVNFYDLSTSPSTLLGSASLITNVDTTASFSVPSLKVGTHSLVAEYVGDTNYSAASSSSPSSPASGLQQVVLAGQSLSSVTATPDGHGHYLLTAQIFPQGTPQDDIGGTVQFYDATHSPAVLLGTSPVVTSFNNSSGKNATGTFTWTASASGAHQVYAVYSGDTHYAGSTSSSLMVNVLAASSTTLATSTSNSTWGSAVTLTASVVGFDAAAPGTVSFALADGTLLSNSSGQTSFPLTGGQAKLTTTTLPSPLANVITATYSGDATSATSVSNSVTVTVASSPSSLSWSSSGFSSHTLVSQSHHDDIYLWIQQDRLYYSTQNFTSTSQATVYQNSSGAALPAPTSFATQTFGTVHLLGLDQTLSLQVAVPDYLDAPTSIESFEQIYNGPQGSLEIDGNVATAGGNLTLAAGQITIPDHSTSSGLTISTVGTTSAGSLELHAYGDLYVGAYNSLKATASGIAAGSVVLHSQNGNFPFLASPQEAFQADAMSVLKLLTGQETTTASLTVASNVSIAGGTVSLKAESGDLWNDLPTQFGNALASGFGANNGYAAYGAVSELVTVLGEIGMSFVGWGGFSFFYDNNAASLTVADNAQINASGNVQIAANATNTAQTFAMSLGSNSSEWKDFSVAMGAVYSSGSASITIDGDVTSTAGNVEITSNVVNDSVVNARAQANLGITPPKEGTNGPTPGEWDGMGSGRASYYSSNFRAGALGLAVVETSSLLTVNSTSAIEAGGTVLLSAAATDVNTLHVSATIFKDGNASVTAGVGITNANVHCLVNGTVTAHGGNLQPVDFNPYSAVSFANSTITFGSNPGYVTGQALNYSSGLGGAIPGLVSGQTYYAITSASSPQQIQLAVSPEDAAAGEAIVFGPSYPTISWTANGVTQVIPLDNVSSASFSQLQQGPVQSGGNLISLDFVPTGLLTGTTVTYHRNNSANVLGYANPSTGQYEGLLPDGQYLVSVTNNTLSNTSAFQFQLTDSSHQVYQLDTSPVLVVAGANQQPIYLRVSSFNTENNTFTLWPLDTQPAQPYLTANAAVTYLSGLSTLVTGLVSGQSYFLIQDPAQSTSGDAGNPNVFQLAPTLQQSQPANAQNQCAPPWFSFVSNGTQFNWNLLDIDTYNGVQYLIFTQTSGLANGQAVVYHDGTAGQRLTGLVDGQTYYAILGDDPQWQNNIAIQLSKSASLTAPLVISPMPMLTVAGVEWNIVGWDSNFGTLTLQSTTPSGKLTTGTQGVYAGCYETYIPGILDQGTYYLANVTPVPGTTGNPQYLVGLSTTAANAQASPPSVISLKAEVPLVTILGGFMSGTTHTLTPTNLSALTIRSVLTSRDTAVVSSGVGSTPKIGAIFQGTFYWDAVAGYNPVAWLASLSKGPAKFSDRLKELAEKYSSKNDKTALAGSLVFMDVTNRVTAEVGPAAALISNGDAHIQAIFVQAAQISDTSTEGTESEDTNNGGRKGYSLAATLGLYDNSCEALVDDGAHIDAAGATAVLAQTYYPYAEQVFAPGGADAFFEELLFSPNVLSNLGALFGGMAGVNQWFFNSWAMAGFYKNDNTSSDAGSFNLIEISNNVQAQIYAGAQINQTSSLQNANQSVSVNASNLLAHVGVAGNVRFKLDHNSLYTLLTTGKPISSEGDSLLTPTVGGTSAGGAALSSFIVKECVTQAAVGNPDPNHPATGQPARINFGAGETLSTAGGTATTPRPDGKTGFEVSADNTVFNMNLSQSGADSGGVVVAGNVSLQTVSIDTLAQIQNGCVITSNVNAGPGANVT